MELGQTDAALVSALRAAGREDAPSSTKPHESDVWVAWLLAGVMRTHGNLTAAQVYADRALSLLEKDVGPGSHLLAPGLVEIGEIQLANSDHRGAAVSFTRADEIFDDAQVDPSAQTSIYFGLSRALAGTNDLRGDQNPRVRPLAEKAVDACRAEGRSASRGAVAARAWLIQLR